MRICCVLIAASLPLVAAENAQELVRKAIENYRRDAQSALRYTYTTTDHTAKGVEVTQVMTIEGTPFERLIAKNGQALSGEEERRQSEKYEAAVMERGRESVGARARRVAKYRDQANFLRDVPEAFSFTMMGEEPIDGRVAYVIKCVPRADYQAHDMRSKMFSKVTAKLWIDKQDVRMARAEAEIIDTMSIGLIMARVGKGGHIEMTQTRVAEDVWLPKTIDVAGNARILLVDAKRVEERIVFEGFRAVGRVTLAQNGVR